MAYLELFHGRKTPEEHLDDWGEQGPVFGPFPYFHTTYALEIKFGEAGHVLSILEPDGLVYYDGMYYGDWSVFSAEEFDSNAEVQRRLAAFQQEKADLPRSPTSGDRVSTLLTKAEDTMEEYKTSENVDSLAIAHDAIAEAQALLPPVASGGSAPLRKAAPLSGVAGSVRFDGYLIQPVVETTAPDGIERAYEIFPTLAEAEAEVRAFRSRPSFEGVEGQCIVWSLFGLRRDRTDHVGDRATEAEAFALLYAISGITGTAGHARYRLPRLWSVLHEHRHGIDVWVVASDDEPTETQLVRRLDIDFEPSRGEEITVAAVNDVLALD